ncbi:bifunctional riboflavin kinase/FAD synthetase [Paenibacillus protaetiae]|uniref:Riboflavin biosynthesis protein n=1 Tax=Paenibacillus protaetiae TaxID=2509456 RepID=A0A4P6F5G1_9BACL|nr:bifunctional riboflavin kinase/FAD synthetase [Paenibacillus protaetiae]QAY65638.1 bifunctional riboflavin kinase/FAD synthetase [Paenibacillus protaetiae]
MEIISLTYPLDRMPALLQGKSLAVAIGHFDGVHLGHQDVIRTAVATAKQEGILSAVMTFHPHPKEVLGQGDYYHRSLTPLQDKTALFERLGVDIAFVVAFDTTFASVMPEQFVNEILRPLHAKHVVVGFDFTFGHKGQGNAKHMLELCKPDITVQIVEPLCLKGSKVSSSSVRAALAEGNVTEAAELLGRPYEVTGIVVDGDKRGRTIGFPTANVSPSSPYVLPAYGVYAISVDRNGETYYGVLNLGFKPTFNAPGGEATLEAHLFDFAGNLYGERLTVRFHSFIRNEQKFNSIHELVEQIHRDSETARQLFQLKS